MASDETPFSFHRTFRWLASYLYSKASLIKCPWQRTKKKKSGKFFNEIIRNRYVYVYFVTCKLHHIDTVSCAFLKAPPNLLDKSNSMITRIPFDVILSWSTLNLRNAPWNDIAISNFLVRMIYWHHGDEVKLTTPITYFNLNSEQPKILHSNSNKMLTKHSSCLHFGMCIEFPVD